MRNLWRAWQFFRPDWPLVVGAFGLLLAGTWANLLKPWPLALIVDSVFGSKPLPAWLGRWESGADKAWLVAALAGIVLALHAGQAALAAGQGYLAIRIGLRGLRRVRNAVFGRLQRLSLRFHQGASSGETIYRATWDTYTFQTLFQQGLVTFCTALLALVMMVGVMWRLNHQLTLVALGTLPLLLIIIKGCGREMQDRAAQAQQADSQVAALVQQCLVNLPVIQSYTREAREQARFTAQTEQAQGRRLRQHSAEVVYWLGVSLVFALGTAAILWLGSGQVVAGKLSVGQLLIFLAYLTQLYEPLNQLSHVGMTVSHAGAGTQRVFALLDSPEEVPEAHDALPLGGVRVSQTEPAPGETKASAGASPPPPRAGAAAPGGLSFEGVCFGYEADRAVLHDVTFSLAPGESAAVIGPSGAGKSTLLHLLPRFHDPARGAVKLDGQDLRRLRLGDLRRHVALVMQEPLLLPGTIAENIACGQPDATAAQIEAAAKQAHADGFIGRLPRGYETVVGEGALRLSVGEKQRIGLARAFLKDAPLVALDEPTSALDPESEALVAASLASLLRGRTALMATHRWRTLAGVNRVLVLVNGRLVENGTPAELLANPQSYCARLLGRR